MDKTQKIFLGSLWTVIIIGLGFIAYSKFSDQEPEFNPENLIGTPEIIAEDPVEIPTKSDLNQALQLIEGGKNSEARAILVQELQKEPDSLQIQIAIGRTYLYENKIEQAREIFWQLDEDLPEVQLYRSIVLFFYQEFDNSRAELSANSHPRLYNAFETFDYYTETEISYLKALYAKALIEISQHQAAMPILNELINQNPNYRDAWIMLGYSYMKISRLDDAIHALEKAYNLDPEKAEALYYLGAAYSLNGDEAAGKIYINQAKALGFQL